MSRIIIIFNPDPIILNLKQDCVARRDRHGGRRLLQRQLRRVCADRRGRRGRADLPGGSQARQGAGPRARSGPGDGRRRRARRAVVGRGRGGRRGPGDEGRYAAGRRRGGRGPGLFAGVWPRGGRRLGQGHPALGQRDGGAGAGGGGRGARGLQEAPRRQGRDGGRGGGDRGRDPGRAHRSQRGCVRARLDGRGCVFERGAQCVVVRWCLVN